MSQTSFLELKCVYICRHKVKVNNIYQVIKNRDNHSLSNIINLTHLQELFQILGFWPKNRDNHSWSNLILNILDTISDWSWACKFFGLKNLWIFGQCRLHINVNNKSGNPTWLQIVIPSKYNWSMYRCPPTKLEGKIICFMKNLMVQRGLDNENYKSCYIYALLTAFDEF